MGKCGEFSRRGRRGAVLGGLICLAGAAAAEAPPRIAGAPATVYASAAEGCAPWDIPDTPARAWRGADGRVRLVSGSEASRAMVGPRLGALVRDCAVLYRGAGDDDPAAQDDRAWVHAVHADGERVIALAHVEYHGHLRAERCGGDYLACWRNVVVELRSEDGGRTFRRAGTVAAPPYAYRGDEGRRSGYFNPSNILRRDGHLYAFVFAEALEAQRRGACLLRRPVEGGPADWRAWDGAAFAARFSDPYREAIADPAAHVCAPVEGVASTISSVVERAGGGGYVAVTATERRGPDGRMRSGIYWTVSHDLLRWSAPRLLWEAPLLWRRDCAAPAAYAYPALLDYDAGSANFETVDDRFWLYVVRMPLGPGCRVGPERELVRLPVSWPGP